MRIATLTITLLLSYTSLVGQTVNYADSVVNYSSQFGSVGFAAQQILGAPDVYPSYGDLAGAWAPMTQDGQRESIELFFDNGQPIDSIFIYETYNGGSIDTVYAWNPGSSSWDILYQGPVDTIKVARIFKIGFPKTSYGVSRIRIAMNSPVVPGWNELDAVALITNGGPSSVSAHASRSSEFVWPNPGEIFQVKLSEQDHNGVVEVLDLYGRVISREMAGPSNQLTIDLSGEPAGVYVGVIRNTESTRYFKLVRK